MAYIDVWKKKMQNYGGNRNDSVLISTKGFINREFKNDPSYRSAVIQKLDMTREPIDIRVKIVDNTTTKNKIIFLPDTKIEVGSYIEYEDEIWLIREFQSKGLSPYGVAYYCNQTITWEGLENPIPCYVEDSAYNDKGEINLDYFSMVDGKIACYVPWNEITNHIEQNMRFIFNNHPMMIFEVISIKNVSVPNILKIIMKKVEYFEGEDRLENNVAYNEKFEYNPNEVEVVVPTNTNTLVSSSKGNVLRQYNATTFTMMLDGQPSTENWTIDIEYQNINQNDIKIESITSNSIKIRNMKATQGNIIVKFTKGNDVITESVVMSR